MSEIVANPDPVKVIGRASECMRRLMEAGLTYDDLQKPINSLWMRKRLVQFWRLGGYPPITSQKRARKIMGRHFIDTADVAIHYGIHYSEEELDGLYEIPYSEKILMECKDDFILVPGYPLSILDIQRVVFQKLFTLAIPSAKPFYYDEGFAKIEKVDLRWYLISREGFSESLDKPWIEQLGILSDDEEAPRACEVVYVSILYRLARLEHLFINSFVRCRDVSSKGSHVIVGTTGNHQIHIGNYFEGPEPDNNWKDYHISLAISKKPLITNN